MKWRISKCLIWSDPNRKQANTRWSDQAVALPARMWHQPRYQIIQWPTESILSRKMITCKPSRWFLVAPWTELSKKSIRIWEVSTTVPVVALAKTSHWKSQTPCSIKTEGRRTAEVATRLKLHLIACLQRRMIWSISWTSPRRRSSSCIRRVISSTSYLLHQVGWWR